MIGYHSPITQMEFRGLWLLGSPLFVYNLLRNVSGIPILEKSGDKRWGHLKSWHEYKRRVPILWPYLKRSL